MSVKVHQIGDMRRVTITLPAGMHGDGSRVVEATTPFHAISVERLQYRYEVTKTSPEWTRVKLLMPGDDGYDIAPIPVDFTSESLAFHVPEKQRSWFRRLCGWVGRPLFGTSIPKARVVRR